MGLTKEVLSTHTHQEEQTFLDRFKDLSKLRVFDPAAPSTLHSQNPAANPLSRGRGTCHVYIYTLHIDTCYQSSVNTADVLLNSASPSLFQECVVLGITPSQVAAPVTDVAVRGSSTRSHLTGTALWS